MNKDVRSKSKVGKRVFKGLEIVFFIGLACFITVLLTDGISYSIRSLSQMLGLPNWLSKLLRDTLFLTVCGVFIYLNHRVTNDE